MYRVLSLDGGGIRGLVPALVLAELEERTGRPVAELFDLVAGTSTGGIIALALLRPDPAGRPTWRARALADFYRDQGPRIFARSWRRALCTVDGLLAPRYAARALEDNLATYLGDTMLGAALRDAIVVTYDLRLRRPQLFKTSDVRAGRAEDQPMRVVARATTAAPTYFAPGRVPKRGAPPQWLVDGGVFANNPAMCAYADVRRDRPDDDVLLVSVGTGALSTDYATRRLRSAGSLGWARPLFNVVLDGQEDATDYQLRQLTGGDRYVRLQADLPTSAQRIDDAGPGNLRTLAASTERLLRERSGELDDVARLLTAPTPAVPE